MTVVKHELRQGRTSFIIWTASVALLLAVCVFLFPEMKGQAQDIGDMFSSMGSFTAAFGMDRLNFGTLAGYYAIECGNVLGLGGAFFAAMCAAGILSKEEKDRTAEFLLTHPVSRARIVSEKLAAVFI
ncbi:MAG: ABC transporter permease subunit, partial [Candidatus Avispirillum sp.]